MTKWGVGMTEGSNDRMGLGVFERGQSPLFSLKGGGWEKIK
jgi:hypothetical protein